MAARVKGKFSTSQDALIEIDGHIPFLRQKIHWSSRFSRNPDPRYGYPRMSPFTLRMYILHRRLEKFDIAMKLKLGLFSGSLLSGPF